MSVFNYYWIRCAFKVLYQNFKAFSVCLKLSISIINYVTVNCNWTYFFFRFLVIATVLMYYSACNIAFDFSCFFQYLILSYVKSWHQTKCVTDNFHFLNFYLKFLHLIFNDTIIAVHVNRKEGNNFIYAMMFVRVAY